jgi:hypothetical protein
VAAVDIIRLAMAVIRVEGSGSRATCVASDAARVFRDRTSGVDGWNRTLQSFMGGGGVNAGRAGATATHSPDQDLARVSPLIHTHVIPNGTYRFGDEEESRPLYAAAS